MITDPTIDPITGLPILNPEGPVQQIPLGAQVFPFVDLNATAQPTRGPIYGDDIIPTSALLSAQHPMTGAAQTVTTDGEHAARVYVVNESGGGGGSAPTAQFSTQGVANQTGDPSTGLLFSLPIGPGALSVLWRAEVAVIMPVPGSGTNVLNHGGIDIVPDNATTHRFWNVFDPTPITTTGKAIMYRDILVYNPGWDILGEFGGGQQLGFYARHFPVAIYLCYVYYT